MTVEYQKFLPQGFTQHPTTVLEALRQGKAVLVDEQNWIKGQLFNNDHPDEDPDNAFCNSWQACAMGAIAMVTIGARRETEKEGDTIVYQDDWEVDDGLYSTDNEADRKLYMKAIGELESVLPSYEVDDEVEFDPATRQYITISTKERQYGEVWEFNDADNTTHQQVMDAFNRAIAKAEEKEAASA